MRLTKFGHSCLLVEEAGARVLLDPGTWADRFDELEGLTAVLVTHQHADHLDPARVRALLDRNPSAQVVSDEGSAPVLGEAGVDVRVVREGDELDLGGVPVRVAGREHAVIYPEIPRIPNVGYLVGGRLFHPGDAFTVPAAPVEVLAVPAAAPWLTLAAAIDYLRQVRPKVAVPIHERVLSPAGIALHYGNLERLGAGDATAFRNLDDGKPVEL
jgi:L-ascorbate metabolism protein UlaG (beta-lactamase superfamily)